MDIDRQEKYAGSSDDAAIHSLKSVAACNKGITSMLAVAHLGQMVNLTSLNLHMNHISKIESLKLLVQLTSLDLSANDIDSIEGISHLSELTSLNLSSNRIASAAKGLTGLRKLRRLSIAFNTLKTADGLDDLVALTYVDLAGNKIEKPSQLQSLVKLSNLQQLRLAVPHTSSAAGVKPQLVSENPLVVTTPNYVELVHDLMPSVRSIDDVEVVFDPLAEERDRLSYLRAQPLEAPPLGKVDEYLRALNAVPLKPRMKKVTRGTMTDTASLTDLPSPPSAPESQELSNLRHALQATKDENMRLSSALEAAHRENQADRVHYESATQALEAEHNAATARLQREAAKPVQQLLLMEAELAQVRHESSQRLIEKARLVASLEKENSDLKKKCAHNGEEIKSLLRELKSSEHKARFALATFERSMRSEMDDRLGKERTEVERRVREEFTQRLADAELQHAAAVRDMADALQSRHASALAAVESKLADALRDRTLTVDVLERSRDFFAHSRLTATELLEECDRQRLGAIRDGEMQSMALICSYDVTVFKLRCSLLVSEKKRVKPSAADASVMTECPATRCAGSQTAAVHVLPCAQCQIYNDVERPRLCQCIATLERQLRELLDESSTSAERIQLLQGENAQLSENVQNDQEERDNMLRTIRNLKESLKRNEQAMQELEEEASAKIESKRSEARDLVAENERLRGERDELTAELIHCKSKSVVVRSEDTAVSDNLRRAVDALRAQLLVVDTAYRAVCVEKSALAQRFETMDAAWKAREGDFQQALQEQRTTWEKKLQSIVSQALK